MNVGWFSKNNFHIFFRQEVTNITDFTRGGHLWAHKGERAKANFC
jgi:hypothetical protein